MRSATPPVPATWILEHLTPGANTNDLVGDLAEEFRCGRSVTWYWRQVLVAMAIGICRELRRSTPVLAFVLLWSTLAPVWWFYVERSRPLLQLFDAAVALRFPYSTLCLIVIRMGPDLAFIWLGLSIYALFQSTTVRLTSLQRLWKCFAISTPVFFVALLGCGYFLDLRLSTRGVTVLSLFTQRQFLLYRLPFFLTLLLSIWGLRPRAADDASDASQSVA